MIIRKATITDHDKVLELMGFLQPNDPKVSKSQSESIFTEILNSTNFTITLAEKNDTIVGSCYINIIPNLTRSASPYGVLENVVTHPSYRRQGVGKALIGHALKFAKEQRCYKVMLLTGGDENVQRFYKSCGMKSGIKTAFVERWGAD